MPLLSKIPPTATGCGSSTTYTGPVSRWRKSSSVKACSRSNDEPKASGESASERSRMSRKSAQSSGVRRRSSVIGFPEDARGADIYEPDPSIDARGGVVAGAQEHRPHTRVAAGLDERACDRGP